MPRDAFVLRIQRELCHPKCARKVSGLSKNGPQASVTIVHVQLKDLSQEIHTTVQPVFLSQKVE